MTIDSRTAVLPPLQWDFYHPPPFYQLLLPCNIHDVDVLYTSVCLENDYL